MVDEINIYPGGVFVNKQFTEKNTLESGHESYCSLVTFREVFFVNKVHRKPENCGAKSCECAEKLFLYG